MKKSVLFFLLLALVVGGFGYFTMVKYLKSTYNEFEKIIHNELDSVSKMSGTPQKVIEKDCVFDLAQQTDDFLITHAALRNHIWNNDTKTATVYLENGDTIFIERGGCQYFNFYITQKFRHSEWNIKQTQKIYQHALDLTQMVMDITEQQQFQYALATGAYEKNQYDHLLKLTFDFPDKCMAELIFEQNPKTQLATLKIGYTLCENQHP